MAGPAAGRDRRCAGPLAARGHRDGRLGARCRRCASEGRSPLAIASLVNRVLQHYHPNILATLCLALLDPPSGELEIVNCGHIPPLIVDGVTAAYRGKGGLLLGMPVHKPHV